MEFQWAIALFILAAGAGLVYIASRWRVRKTPDCPQCSARDVVEIRRDLLASDHITIPEAFGYQVRMQQTFQLTYRCNACNHAFSRQVTETDL